MHARTLLAAVAVVAAAALVGVPVGSVAADHGTVANFTVVPETDADRRPGIDDASYMSFTVGDASGDRTGFKHLGYSVLEWDAGTLGRCGPGDAAVAGIDRDNDDPGTEVDESVQDNIEGQPVSNEDREVVDFDDPDTIGQQPVHLNVTDQFVVHMTDCRGNPGEPGWYQITGTVNGTTWNDEHAEYTTTSHYFYICDCGSYDEAERELGPPPSKEGRTTPSPTASAGTPTAEPTPTRTPPPDGTPFPSPTPTTASSGTAGTGGADATGTATEGGSGGADATDAGASTSTASATPAAWAANTPASGPGFGVVAALAALLGAIAVARRRA